MNPSAPLRRAGLLPPFLALLLCLSVAPARASSTDFVSNLSVSSNGTTAIGTSIGALAAQFTTATGGNWTITSAQVSVASVAGTLNSFSVAIYSDNSNAPGTALTPGFSGNATPTAGSNTYTPTATLTLQGGTKYWLVCRNGTSDAASSVQVTTAASAATDLSVPWTMGGRAESVAGSFFAVGSWPQFQLNGIPAVVAPTVTNATLAATANFNGPFSFTIASSVGGVTYSASGLPQGLAINSTTGVISGTPTQVGTFTVTLGVTNTAGTGNATLTLTVGKALADVILGGLTPTYTGSPISATATTGPAGLATTFTYAGSPTPPTAVGTYTVVATVNDPNYSGAASGAMIISPASQTIVFPAAVAAAPGVAVSLAATASSGLPVTLTLVSGNAVLSGSTLTLNDSNPVVVQASQAGNANYTAAPTVSQTIVAAKQGQSIVFATPANLSTGTASLAATASSGLPVTFTLISGPATLSGSTLTLSGTGQVVVQASQAGNAAYAAATATQTFTVSAASAQAFFGGFSGSAASGAPDGFPGRQPRAAAVSVAAFVGANGTGSLIGVLPGGTAGFAVTFSVNAAGQFAAVTAERTGSNSTGPSLVIQGSISGATLSGTITGGANLAFSLAGDSAAGASANIAGFYPSASLQAANGSAYSVVGTQNDVFVLALAPNTVAGGSGTVTGGSFSLQASANVAVTGTVNAATTTVTGTIATPSGTSFYSGLSSATAHTGRMVNLSTLGTVGTGQNVLVTGFVIGGSAAKPMLLRGVGPGLAGFGLSGLLGAPVLTLYDRGGQLLATNAGWGGGAALAAVFSQVGAFALAPASADAAISATLAPGPYTIQVAGANGATGKALIEIYDATAETQNQYQQLLNISSRGQVTGTSAPLTGGFIVTGNDSKQLLIRGVGPALAPFGIGSVLADPVLTVLNSSGAVVAGNDNWSTPLAVTAGQTVALAADITAAQASVGAFPLAAGSKDAALIVTLPPGSYTAQVTGGAGSSGIALVEIYELPAAGP